MRRPPHIHRTRRGEFELTLEPAEREALHALPEELRSLLESRDPSIRRLFPPAYEDDPERQEEYDRLMHEDLLTGKRAALEIMESTLDAKRLTEDELVAWLGVLNDLRLVFGTRLDVTEDMDDEAMLRGPHARAYALYYFLGWLEEQAVEALSAGV